MELSPRITLGGLFWLICSRSTGRYARRRFSLYFRKMLQQALHFNQSHRRKVFAHQLAVCRPHVAKPRCVFVFVGNKNKKPRNVLRGYPGFTHNRKHIRERLCKLIREVVADYSSFFVPSNLTCNKKKRPAINQHAVVIADRLRERFRLDYLHLAVWQFRDQFATLSPLNSFRSQRVPSVAIRFTNPNPAT